MPMQTQQSSLAKKIGGRLAEVNSEHAGKPIEVGSQKLPGGISDRVGIAKVVMMTWKEQDKDDGKVPRGQTYFFGRAIVLSPVEHGGMKVAGMGTIQSIPLCDVPAKGKRKASTFSDNWNKFRSLIELLGIAPCPENKQTDPTGVKTEAYFLAAMQTLTSKERPVYVKFSTKAIAGEKTPNNPDPEPYIYEQWHGLAKWDGKHDPASGVTEAARQIVDTQPEPFEEPPTGVIDPRSVTDVDPEDLAEEVAALVEIATADPDGTTEDGAEASARLEELAWAAGWNKEETAGAADWAAVGEMSLNPPKLGETAPVANHAHNGRVTVGSKWKFSRRDKQGNKLKAKDGGEFPPNDVEVATVDDEAKTCTVRMVGNGRDVVDVRSKKPVAVKFEWLERIA